MKACSDGVNNSESGIGTPQEAMVATLMGGGRYVAQIKLRCRTSLNFNRVLVPIGGLEWLLGRKSLLR